MEEYYKLGARFAKWRAVISISNENPSLKCIKSNAHSLARYAALVQEANMVPIVEPEVLMDGDHTIDKCYDITSKVLTECYKELEIHNVNLKATVLKPNMILPGKNCEQKGFINRDCKENFRMFKKNVPSSVPGVAFLSGGQSEIEATKNLNEINKINDTSFNFTFPIGRALQQSALKTWAKSMSNITKVQEVFNHRAKMNGASTEAKWDEKLEQNFAA